MRNTASAFPQHRSTRPRCSDRRRCVIPDLLRGSRAVDLAGADRSGTGSSDPRSLAEADQHRGGVVGRPAQIHSLWRHRDHSRHGRDRHAADGQMLRQAEYITAYAGGRRSPPRHASSPIWRHYAVSGTALTYITPQCGRRRHLQHLAQRHLYCSPADARLPGQHRVPIYQSRRASCRTSPRSTISTTTISRWSTTRTRSRSRGPIPTKPIMSGGLKCAERDNAYNLTTVESRDQNAIELYGMRIAPTVTAHEICDPNVALISGQLMLQRAVYIRNTYQVPAVLGILPARSDGSGDASPMPFSACQRAASASPKSRKTRTAFSGDAPRNFRSAGHSDALRDAAGRPTTRSIATSPPDPVNAPIIFEPPSALVGARAQVWIAASGGSGGVADPELGRLPMSGCRSTARPIARSARSSAPARAGRAHRRAAGYQPAPIPIPPTRLPSTWPRAAACCRAAPRSMRSSANTLCIVDCELISYETATLTSASHYSLTTLYRGLYGTAIAAHSSGAPFARLDSAIFEYDLPPQYVGQTLYIKLQSFNVFGGGVQDLSCCAAYTYTPTGVAIDHPVARALAGRQRASDFGVGDRTPPPDRRLWHATHAVGRARCRSRRGMKDQCR